MKKIIFLVLVALLVSGCSPAQKVPSSTPAPARIVYSWGETEMTLDSVLGSAGKADVYLRLGKFNEQALDWAGQACSGAIVIERRLLDGEVTGPEPNLEEAIQYAASIRETACLIHANLLALKP